ncbi:hypothetical protein A2V68_02725 [candidate division Kazan bacterium RBG_13_50_9]|uniref:Uncharacterized protein n=1 Tax=candidate division Kazan bacterium RBG_13_50_9 TaxID=1798535 RepID=A0A1F4NSU5_UNCK3|nr:MAG: hypothetical protein A2V68_02725 [candidate division Kazan bacterium RBG_13_50_9]
MPVTHWELAYRVFDTLIAALRRHAYPYDVATRVYSKETLPRTLEPGGVEEANFLLAVCCYMRGNIRSDVAFNGLANLYDKHRELFDPKQINCQPLAMARLLEKELTERRFTRIEEVCRQWIDNFIKLDRFWDGDATELFADADYETLCERFICRPVGKFNPNHPDGFRGFREKMVSMVAFYFVKAGLAVPMSMPIPIDFHAMRIIISNGLITIPGAPDDYDLWSEKMSATARELTQRYCRDRGINPTELCDTTWFLSSVACRRHPGNRSIVTKEWQGDRLRTIEVIPWAVRWTKQDIMTYRSTCGRCPIEETCRWLAPSAPHYRLGKLQIRGPRGKPPQLALFGGL